MFVNCEFLANDNVGGIIGIILYHYKIWHGRIYKKRKGKIENVSTMGKIIKGDSQGCFVTT